MNEPDRPYTYMVLLYDDNPAYDVSTIISTVDHYYKLGIYVDFYALIKHDKDLLADNYTPEQEHFHLCIKMKNATFRKHFIQAILKDQKVPEQNIIGKNDSRTAFAYLIHKHEKESRYHHYDPSEVMSPDPDKYLKLIADPKKKSKDSPDALNDVFMEICNHIVETEEGLSHYALMKWCSDQGIDYFRVYCTTKYSIIINQVLKEENYRKGYILQ